MALYTDYRKVETVVTDAAAINNAIRNILFTAKGSLPGKPTFGSRINELIFSQLDAITKDLLKRYIREALVKFERRIVVTSVVVSEAPEYNRIIASINYMYRDRGLAINEQISVGFSQ